MSRGAISVGKTARNSVLCKLVALSRVLLKSMYQALSKGVTPVRVSSRPHFDCHSLVDRRGVLISKAGFFARTSGFQGQLGGLVLAFRGLVGVPAFAAKF